MNGLPRAVVGRVTASKATRFVFIGTQGGGPRPIKFKHVKPGQTMRTFVRWRG